ncbi:MAG: tetratricopeptide repeat protein [Chitinophagaceae bacterium]|nr:tetratricopeptide repeat protein [Chitinophagaceae bacterium]
MKQQPYHEGKGELNQILIDYHNLRTGRKHRFLDEESFILIIDHFDEKENHQEAIIAAEIGLEQYPYSAELMFRKADLLISTKKYLEALDLLDTAAIYDGMNISFYILKTDALLALDRQPEAVELLQTALEYFEGDEKVDLLFDLADVYDDYEEFDKVFDCLTKVLEVEPNNEEALYKICFWTDFTGRYDESIILHQKIINESPYNEIAWFNLGTAFQGLKLYEKAIDAYQYAVVIEEKFDYAYRNMGDAYLRLKKYKEAIEVLEKVLELSRPEDVIYEALGHCYHKMRNTAQARFNYKKAVHLNNEDARLHYKVANTYMLDGQWQKAVKHLEDALRLNRHSKEFNLAMGECKMQLNLFKEAITYFGSVVLHRPTNVSGWAALIRCMLKANMLEQANERCIVALHQTNRKPLILFLYTATLFAQNKTKEALIQLENAMEIDHKFLKILIEMHPHILQNNQVLDIIARYKSKKRNSKRK